MPYGAERKAAWERLNPLIGKANQQLIDQSNLIFAVLDGVDVDSGTAAEIGSGFAKGKKIIGYRGDFSLSADNEGSIVNLQVEYFIEASGGVMTPEMARSLTPGWIARIAASCALMEAFAALRSKSISPASLKERSVLVSSRTS